MVTNFRKSRKGSCLLYCAVFILTNLESVELVYCTEYYYLANFKSREERDSLLYRAKLIDKSRDGLLFRALSFGVSREGRCGLFSKHYYLTNLERMEVVYFNEHN